MQKDKKQHPHKELIEMWASNTSLQFEYRQHAGCDWKLITEDNNGPRWNPNFQYRLKREMVDKFLIVFKTKDGTPSISNRYYRDIEEFKRSISFADRLEWTEIVIASKQTKEV